MLLFHSWFRFILRILPPNNFGFNGFSSWSISSSHILKAELANALQALPARKVPCPGMLWILLAERYVKKYVMVLLWKERICPKICQRRDFLTFLMFLYFRISVLDSSMLKLLYVVRVLGVTGRTQSTIEKVYFWYYLDLYYISSRFIDSDSPISPWVPKLFPRVTWSHWTDTSDDVWNLVTLDSPKN